MHVIATYAPDKSESTREEKIELHNGDELMIQRAGNMVLRVNDSGAGMTREQIAQLFRPNTQFNANALQHGQGSGLGLFIAKGIAEQHGGSLTASSAGLGLGSTFTFSLPLFCLPESVEDILGYSHRSDRVSQLEDIIPPKDLKVLVVDDARSNRRFLVRWLTNHGHQCDEAADGLEAVDLVIASNEPYDVILMDGAMPHMNGGDAIKKIRDFGCNALIIGISGNVLQEDIDLFMISGANAVLPKPLQFSDLDALLSEYSFPKKYIG